MGPAFVAAAGNCCAFLLLLDVSDPFGCPVDLESIVAMKLSTPAVVSGAKVLKHGINCFVWHAVRPPIVPVLNQRSCDRPWLQNDLVNIMLFLKSSLSYSKVSEHPFCATVYHRENVRSRSTHRGHLNNSTSPLLLFKALMRYFVVQNLRVNVYFHQELQIVRRLVKYRAESKCSNVINQETKVVSESWRIELFTIVDCLRVINMEG